MRRQGVPQQPWLVCLGERLKAHNQALPVAQKKSFLSHPDFRRSRMAFLPSAGRTSSPLQLGAPLRCRRRLVANEACTAVSSQIAATCATHGGGCGREAS